MRLVTLRHQGGEVLGIHVGEEILAGPPLPGCMLDAVHLSADELHRIEAHVTKNASLHVPVVEATFCPPIRRPGKIIA